MNSQILLFQMTVASGLIVWTAVSKAFIWPKISSMSLLNAAKPLLYLNLFRYIGLIFMIPGVVSSQLPSEFSTSAGWGDLTAAGLAALTLLLSETFLFKPSLWLFNIFGIFDLLHAFYEARFVLGVSPSDFGAAIYLPTIYVPLLLCAHVMIFVLLFRKQE